MLFLPDPDIISAVGVKRFCTEGKMWEKEKSREYEELCRRMEAALSPKEPAISSLSNAAAILYEGLERVNWAGFYLRAGSVLWLGPFQGRPACVRIELGKGVCGTAAAEKRTVLVEDVHCFPGHIACDSASRSEIVVPLYRDGEVMAVMDIDSPQKGRFDKEDREGLERIVGILERAVKNAAAPAVAIGRELWYDGTEFME